MRWAIFIAATSLSAGAGLAWLTRSPHIPPAEQPGTGADVELALFSDHGQRLPNATLRKISHSDSEWRNLLTPEQFAITRGKSTEPPFHNLYWNRHTAGIYRCVSCGTALFRSQEKYDSDTGWPSFWAPIATENISLAQDNLLGVSRTEILCRKCDAHLGHVFDDGPPPTGKRYCLNSAALYFVQSK